MCGEHQPCAVGHRLRRRADGFGEHLDEQRMIEVLTQFDKFRRALAGRSAGPCDVLDVLGTAGVAAPRRRGEHGRPANPVVAHGRDGVLDVGFPIAVAEVDRQIDLAPQLCDQLAVDAVDRRDAAEMQVVFRDVGQPFTRDAAAAGDVLQERHDLLGTLRPPERQQQDSVELH